MCSVAVDYDIYCDVGVGVDICVHTDDNVYADDDVAVYVIDGVDAAPYGC